MIGHQNSLQKLEDKTRTQQKVVDLLKQQMSSNVEDWRESAMKRINNQVRISEYLIDVND